VCCRGGSEGPLVASRGQCGRPAASWGWLSAPIQPAAWAEAVAGARCSNPQQLRSTPGCRRCPRFSRRVKPRADFGFAGVNPGGSWSMAFSPLPVSGRAQHARLCARVPYRPGLGCGRCRRSMVISAVLVCVGRPGFELPGEPGSMAFPRPGSSGRAAACDEALADGAWPPALPARPVFAQLAAG